MKRIAPICMILPLLAALLSIAAPAAAQSEKHAGLVVQFGDGSVQTYCVAFTEESISGLDVLLRARLDVRVQGYGSLGAWVCKIGPDGCDYPDQPCVCQSYGPNGVYWSYHHLREGRWRASTLGASSYRVRDGDVEGWAWSSGGPPALYTFEQLCGSVRSQATNMPPPAPTWTPVPAPPTSTKVPPTPVPDNPATTQQLAQPEPTAPDPVPTIGALPTVQPTLPQRQAATPTRTVPPTHTPQPQIVTATQEPDVPTFTATPTEAAAISKPIPTSTPTKTLTPSATPTPTPTLTPNPQPLTPTPDLARNVALAIGVIALLGLAAWYVLRRRGGRGVG